MGLTPSGYCRDGDEVRRIIPCRATCPGLQIVHHKTKVFGIYLVYVTAVADIIGVI